MKAMYGVFKIWSDREGKFIVAKGVFTRNFARLLLSLLAKQKDYTPSAGGLAGEEVTLVDKNGNSRGANIVGTCYDNIDVQNYATVPSSLSIAGHNRGFTLARKLYMAIGNGTNAPSPDDHALGNELMQIPLTSNQEIDNDTNTIIKFTGSASPSEDITITEAGVFANIITSRGRYINSIAYAEVLLDRATFSAKSFSAGETINAEYSITLE